MESRGRTFLQELRDAIHDAERVLLVVGPEALKSDYVQLEWQHALLYSRAVMPLLRAGLERLRRARVDRIEANIPEYPTPTSRA